jgi:hypothetical protein
METVLRQRAGLSITACPCTIWLVATVRFPRNFNSDAITCSASMMKVGILSSVDASVRSR